MTAPLRIVSIGGGTGLSALLSGLKKYTQPFGSAVDVTAIVTVTDDGGSSGRLRREFEVLPPGDIRNCMVALSEDEALLSRLFQYRFQNGHGLKGHSFGNLFLTALTRITATSGTRSAYLPKFSVSPAPSTRLPPRTSFWRLSLKTDGA